MNLQVVIELLLKNKKAVEEVLEQLNKQYNLDIDTSDLDAAMSELSDHDVVISADASQAEEAANDAEAEIEEIPEEHETEISAEDNSTSVITAISTGYMALMQVIGQAKGKIDELVNLSGEQEKAENLLQVSLKNTGDATQATFEKFKDLAGSYQNLTTIGDETTMGIMHLGLNMNVMTEDLEEATKGAIGLSKSFGLDLKTAMKMHTLAMDKDFTMLQRYLPALKTAKTESEKMEIVKRAEANGWKLATSEVDKGYGSLEQYGNTLGDVKEKIGDLVMSAMKPLMSVTHEWLTALDDALKKPLSDKIRDEQIEFNSLVGILKDVNSLQATRNMAIAELQEKYPDFIGNIDLEKASVAELEIALKSANDEFQRKIDMQVAEEVLADKRKDLAKVTKDLFYSEKSLHEQQQKGVEQNVSSLLAYRNTEEAIERERNKVNELTTELGDLETELKRQGLVTDESTEKTNKQTEGVDDQIEAYINLGKAFGLVNEEYKGFEPPKLDAVKQSMSELMTLFGSHTKQLEELRQAGVDTTTLLEEQWRVFTDNIKTYYGEDSLEYQAALNMKKDAETEYFEWKKEKWIKDNEFVSGIFSSIGTGYDKLINTMTDKEMTGKKRRELIWDSMKKSFLKMIGSMLKKYIANLLIQSVISKGAQTLEIASATASGTAIAAAYAPAASMASLASFGLNSIPASAGIVSTTALAQLLAIPKLAKGAVVEEETLAVIGEAGTEAVVPLPDGKSIPVKNMGGDSKILKAILIELKAMHLDMVRQSSGQDIPLPNVSPEQLVTHLLDVWLRMWKSGNKHDIAERIEIGWHL